MKQFRIINGGGGASDIVDDVGVSVDVGVGGVGVFSSVVANNTG
jgi:hypothetical protein